MSKIKDSADAHIQKTNAMRELDVAGVPYDVYSYEIEDEVSVGIGVRVALETGVESDSAFKTLVCVSPNDSRFVFCIPVASELDLKKAAKAAGEKTLSLAPIARLQALTGYIRGGCSPVGMKKQYPTFIDETAQLFDAIAISGGRIGVQLVIDPLLLAQHCGAVFCDLVEG